MNLTNLMEFEKDVLGGYVYDTVHGRHKGFSTNRDSVSREVRLLRIDRAKELLDKSSIFDFQILEDDFVGGKWESWV